MTRRVKDHIEFADGLAPIHWPASVEPVGLAAATCRICFGRGFRVQSPHTICGCVYRQVSRIVHRRIHSARENGPGGVRLRSNKRGGIFFSRPVEEFNADYELIAKAELADSPLLREVWWLYLHSEWPYNRCCARLGLPRHHLFYWAYQAEARLGRAFATAQPCRLWPFHEYFDGPLVPGRQMGDLRLHKKRPKDLRWEMFPYERPPLYESLPPPREQAAQPPEEIERVRCACAA